MSHTIAAVSTGNSVSAIGILRLTGDDCIAIADKVMNVNSGRSLLYAPDRKLMLGSLRDKAIRFTDVCDNDKTSMQGTVYGMLGLD